MNNTLIKATLIPDIVRRIATRHGLDENTALDAYYHSCTAKALDDEDTGLYGQSALYIFSLFEEEHRI
jgi:hypothetical protein